MNEHCFCAIGFNNRFRLLWLQFYLLFSRKRVYFYNTLFFKKESIHNWFVKRKKINFINKGIAEINDLSYELHKKSIELTKIFFNKYLNNTYFIRYENKSLATSKYHSYIKKRLVYDISEVMAGLYLVKEFSPDKKVIIPDSPLNRFIIKKFLKYNRVDFDIYWLDFNHFYLLSPLIYYLYVIKKIFTNGITYKNRIEKKLYKEALWGLSRAVLKDDFLIDNLRFKKDDIVFYFYYLVAAEQKFVIEQLKNIGYSVININKSKLNIKNHFLLFVNLFLIKPLWIFLALILNKLAYQIEYVFKFYIDSLPHFLFLTNYKTRCHISNSDHGEVAETIIMNRLGCKNIIYHWSDMTSSNNIYHAFTAHNLYYTWGPIHHNFQKEDYFHDKVEIVGCFYINKLYFDALEIYKNNNKIRKNILLCDTTFDNAMVYSEDSYLDYLDLAIEMLNKIHYVDFIFKPKNNRDVILNSFSEKEKIKIYGDKINYLHKDKRFAYCDYNPPIEQLIASSDIVITMGMFSPSTIALIFGKEALYYDLTGNSQHPMTQYKNKVVFDDKQLLIERVKNILDNKESVFQDIDPALLKEYEPFQDSKALERLIQAVYKETESDSCVIS